MVAGTNSEGIVSSIDRVKVICLANNPSYSPIFHKSTLGPKHILWSHTNHVEVYTSEEVFLSENSTLLSCTSVKEVQEDFLPGSYYETAGHSFIYSTFTYTFSLLADA